MNPRGDLVDIFEVHPVPPRPDGIMARPQVSPRLGRAASLNSTLAGHREWIISGRGNTIALCFAHILAPVTPAEQSLAPHASRALKVGGQGRPIGGQILGSQESDAHGAAGVKRLGNLRDGRQPQDWRGGNLDIRGVATGQRSPVSNAATGPREVGSGGAAADRHRRGQSAPQRTGAVDYAANRRSVFSQTRKNSEVTA